MVDTKIIEKIKNLLALSRDKGASEHEAAVAADKAFELLSKYNLELATVEGYEHDGIEQQDCTDYQTEVWRSWIFSAVAKQYFCFSYRTNRVDAQGKRYNQRTILGQRHNIECVRAMAQYLCGAINSIAAVHCKGKGKAYHTAFKHGMADRIIKRIVDAMKEAQTQPSESGTGIVLRDLYAKEQARINEYMKQQDIRTRKATFRLNQGAGYASGYDAGGNVSLNRPVGAEARGVLPS